MVTLHFKDNCILQNIHSRHVHHFGYLLYAKIIILFEMDTNKWYLFSYIGHSACLDRFGIISIAIDYISHNYYL